MSWSVPVGSVVKVHPSSGREVPLMDDSPALPRLQLGIVAGEARLFITAASIMRQSSAVFRANHRG